MKKYFLCLLILQFTPSYPRVKVLLITHSYNRPDLIEIQTKTFRAFLNDDYEHVIFNDAPNESMKNQIEEACKKCGLRCFRIPQELHRDGRTAPGYRHIDGIQFSLQQLGYNHEGIVGIVDSDLFLLKPFSIEKYMQGYDIAGELQGRENENIKIRHLSPILVFYEYANPA